MATTKVGICNLALRKLKLQTLENFDTDDNEIARTMRDIYDYVLKEVLTEHPWNFAIKRTQLTALGGLITTWADEGSDVWSSPLTTEPKRVKFDGVLGQKVASAVLCVAENDWYWAADVLYVYSTADPDTAYVNPGIEAIIPLYGFAYACTLPADCLRVTKTENDEKYQVENGLLLCDSATINISYIYDCSDVTLFSQNFIGVFALRLAYELAYSDTGSIEMRQILADDDERKLSKSKAVDGQESPVQKDEEDGSWIDARG